MVGRDRGGCRARRVTGHELGRRMAPFYRRVPPPGTSSPPGCGIGVAEPASAGVPNRIRAEQRDESLRGKDVLPGHRVRTRRGDQECQSRRRDRGLRREHIRALPGPGGRGERLRRVEEPVGLGRLHHTGPEALPAHGPADRADLLVEFVRALGRSRSPPGGDHQPAASSARDWPPDPPRRSDAADGDVEPRTAGSGCRGLAADHRLLPDADAKCGAVER